MVFLNALMNYVYNLVFAWSVKSTKHALVVGPYYTLQNSLCLAPHKLLNWTPVATLFVTRPAKSTLKSYKN